MKVQGRQRSFQAWIISGRHTKSRIPALVSRGEAQNCEYQEAAQVRAESSYWNTSWIVLQKGKVALFELSNVIRRMSSFKRLGWGKGSLFPLTHLMYHSLRCSEVSWCPQKFLPWICYSVPPTSCASHSPQSKSLYVHKTPYKSVLVCSSTLSGSRRNSMSLSWEEGAHPVLQ